MDRLYNHVLTDIINVLDFSLSALFTADNYISKIIGRTLRKTKMIPYMSKYDKIYFKKYVNNPIEKKIVEDLNKYGWYCVSNIVSLPYKYFTIKPDEYHIKSIWTDIRTILLMVKYASEGPIMFVTGGHYSKTYIEQFIRFAYQQCCSTEETIEIFNYAKKIGAQYEYNWNNPKPYKCINDIFLLELLRNEDDFDKCDFSLIKLLLKDGMKFEQSIFRSINDLVTDIENKVKIIEFLLDNGCFVSEDALNSIQDKRIADIFMERGHWNYRLINRFIK